MLCALAPMSYLSFEPALDAYHAVFRLTRLVPIIAEAGPVPVDTVRILDFYLVFPFRLADFRARPAHRRLKSVARSYEAKRPFAKLPDDRQLFEQMRHFQTAAIETLAVKQLFEMEALEEREVKVVAVDVAQAIGQEASRVSA